MWRNTMMTRCSPYAWVSQYSFGFFFNYGVYIPFWALWLASLGVATGDIGSLLGLALAVRCFANLFLTPRLHKVEHLLPALRWHGGAALVAGLLYIYCGAGFWTLAMVTILFNLLIGPVIPLCDALCNYYAKHKLLDYGRTRLWGSIAFIVASTMVGLLADRFGAQVIPWVAIAGFVLMLLCSLRQPTVMPSTETDVSQARPAVLALFSQPRVVRFLVVTSLLQASHAAYYSFSSIYWSSIGFSEATIGYLWSFSVIAEVGVFAFGGRFFANWRVSSMLRMAALAVILRWLTIGSVTFLPVLFVIQALHSVTFGVAHLAAIRYIQHAPSNEMVALQSLYNALPLGACMALMTAVSGWMFGVMQADIFYLMALMGVPVLLMKLPEVHTVLQPVQQE